MIPFEWHDLVDSHIEPFIQHTPLTFDAARNLFNNWDQDKFDSVALAISRGNVQLEMLKRFGKDI